MRLTNSEETDNKSETVAESETENKSGTENESETETVNSTVTAKKGILEGGLIVKTIALIAVFGVGTFLGYKTYTVTHPHETHPVYSHYAKLSKFRSAHRGGVDAKPVIYIYSNKDDTPVTVTLGNSDKLSCVYPEYASTGWKVLADKSGNLSIGDTNYYSLYWEGTDAPFTVEAGGEGYCVARDDTADFLEEKLELLGLNYREREEFIIYWLPKLQSNAYNLIKFEDIDSINSYMSLNIDCEDTVDTLIRLNMTSRGVSQYTDMQGQNLEKVDRHGFTVVEWGGSRMYDLDERELPGGVTYE